MIQLQKSILAFTLALGMFSSGAVTADNNAAEDDEIILTVLADGREHEFSASALMALDVTEVVTSTDWTDGEPTFSGALVRAVLAEVMDDKEMPEDGSVLAVAVNEYVVEIPLSDFEKYDVILAMEMDGDRLTLRDKGPIWIVYPRDEHPELVDPTVNARWVWQLERLELQ